MQHDSQDTDFALRMQVELSPSVRDASNQDGAILLDIDSGNCLSLNAVGTKIWQMLKQGWRGDRIVNALQHEFNEMPFTQLKSDYLDFVRQLESNHLARLHPD